ncbi:VRR-NUC domain-containing protein [Enterobacter huaxiensis]|uniref:VRR-NUC domain-containing protein n=1 Tax=Enterobacter huaxiensis TaxID=2494702 RepID=UPI002175EA94|nr:VRR-NUC domain-containing protein [Enterobacter huaxiensis]MCS5452531.1 VRR-NUC domain-containing protein [Enterobacter huaxiensis]
MPYVRENVIESFLVKEVKKRGGIAFKFVSPGVNAVPDRLCLLPGGRIFFVECKAPGQKPRPDQERCHKRIRILGIDVFVMDDRDLKQIGL